MNFMARSCPANEVGGEDGLAKLVTRAEFEATPEGCAASSREVDKIFQDFWGQHW